MINSLLNWSKVSTLVNDLANDDELLNQMIREKVLQVIRVRHKEDSDRYIAEHQEDVSKIVKALHDKYRTNVSSRISQLFPKHGA